MFSLGQLELGESGATVARQRKETICREFALPQHILDVYKYECSNNQRL
jgi:hypothetical protein